MDYYIITISIRDDLTNDWITFSKTFEGIGIKKIYSYLKKEYGEFIIKYIYYECIDNNIKEI